MAFRQRLAIGRRDYAVILTLLRLGLRACEVAALTLDGIDWRQAEIVICGKGGREGQAAFARRCGGGDRRVSAARQAGV